MLRSLHENHNHIMYKRHCSSPLVNYSNKVMLSANVNGLPRASLDQLDNAVFHNGRHLEEAVRPVEVAMRHQR